jgi:hypothetical protein
VWVNKEEIAALAAAIGEPDLTTFEKFYVRHVGIRKSLVEFPNGDCVFFDAKHRTCAVYEARPRQCRTWPFWTSNLSTEQAWQETCKVCPGSGAGKLHDLISIEQMRKVMHL